nr:hypothetical protein REQ54_04376 [Rhizobium sp. Q54]
MANWQKRTSGAVQTFKSMQLTLVGYDAKNRATKQDGAVRGCKALIHPLRYLLAGIDMKIVTAVAFAVCSSATVLPATEFGHVTKSACPLGNCAAPISFLYLGEFVISSGYRHAGVEFGGLSGLEFDAETGRYIGISDDRGEKGPVRLYELDIDAGAKGLKGVRIIKHTVLQDKDGEEFTVRTADPESVRLRSGEIYWTSEGDGKAMIPPSIRAASRDGEFIREFELPTGFSPTADKSTGIRENLAFESMAVLPSGDVLVGLEAALYQDGSSPSLTEGSLARIVRYDGQSGERTAQYVYPVSPIPQAATTRSGGNDNGMSEMIALDDHRLLVVERSYAKGFGNNVKIFVVDLDGATDVSHITALSDNDQTVVPTRKSQVLDLRSLGLAPDNIEAMAIGKGKDGTDVLVLAADNNFSHSQKTQFYAFELKWRAQ